jgi:ataxin-3
MNSNKYVYWEKQESDLLCGLHCLNSLVQAPLFNEIELSEIAQNLDKKEEMLLGTKAFTNVNESGNFSLQVLIEALKSLGDFNIDSINSERNRGKDMRLNKKSLSGVCLS